MFEVGLPGLCSQVLVRISPPPSPVPGPGSLISPRVNDRKPYCTASSIRIAAHICSGRTEKMTGSSGGCAPFTEVFRGTPGGR